MLVSELTLENIRCFEHEVVRLGDQSLTGYPQWISFLSENGGGKSTALQSLGLLLAGPEGAQKLLPRPLGWLRDENRPGKISIRIHQGANDPGVYGTERISRDFGYSYSITGSKSLTINNKLYTEPSIVPAGQSRLTWLRQNAFPSKGFGWFAVGYGAFRRLTRSSQIIVPSLDPQTRFTNFTTQFDEYEPLSIFERWLVYLDYKIAKVNDRKAIRQRELGIEAINRLLPKEARFDSVSSEGRIMFDIGGQKVPTISLSDGYRSILALAGDLVWRMILAFPNSDNPLGEEGVALIDELDIHLHPVWQREIAGFLREQFPRLQFFVATHSPLIAAGAGADALTLKFSYGNGSSSIQPVAPIASLSVDRILESKAFGLVSPYSPDTQGKLDRFDLLNRKGKKRSKSEDMEYQTLFDFMQVARPYGGPPTPGSLEDRIEKFLDKKIK